MGIGFNFKKKNKIARYIHSYVAARVREKEELNQQLTKLETQLQEKEIDEQLYEQFKELLEIKIVQTREEALTKLPSFDWS